MANSVEIWKSGSRQAIWQHFCGFLDMDLAEYMENQKRGLLAQMRLLQACELGRTIMGDPGPSGVEEFRSKVPFTTWGDYEVWLNHKHEEVLPARPAVWVQTTGLEGKPKWVPLTEEARCLLIRMAFAMPILASTTSKGEFSLAKGDVYFHCLAPPPFLSGYIGEIVGKEYGLRIVPPLEEVTTLETLEKRILKGFQLALETGIDVITGLPSVLVKIGAELGARLAATPANPVQPEVSQRVRKALHRAVSEGRPPLPRDLWQLKGMITDVKDLDIFRDRLIRYWGVEPFEVYANTEFAGFVATSTWTRRGMVFLPDTAYLEFIPEEESRISQADPRRVPSTRQLDELCPGERYELVFTSLNGGPFVRYRPGTMIKVLAMEDPEAEVKLPHIAIEGRADKLVDLGGFTRLDDRLILRALEGVGVEYDGWMARKEAEGGHPVLRLYLAPRQQYDLKVLKKDLHQKLKELDSSYRDLEEMLGLQALRLTLLPFGVFTRYTQERLAAGADATELKTQVMEPFEATVERILALAREMGPHLIQDDREG